ncbi:hypothetical protein RIR_jg18702.t2 [Rhizophagus irregularis DAOM 181602=DAOM 197198]|nr:hypothetical protein RIR_jg18702.t2 [Rhizophagus irregularis DAOM 181602=DAOM 197198]
MFARYRIREFFWVECPAYFQKTHRVSLTLQMIPLESILSTTCSGGVTSPVLVVERSVIQLVLIAVSVQIGLHALELNVLSDVFDGFAIFSSLPRRTTLFGFSTELALAIDCLISLISSSILAISILGLKLNNALSQ